ncbi:hypothetical protein BCR44DRAFT_63761 [Catenaria anguillulae PL171]|uniref:Uncharacterized protein n=1 Tax=Catenaria anguillulae PL171 TaxID=765915 RepID=A0A1Y2HI43_9FUNG|nr:hypothetical protein BCR44DRAFT_63761 [Catenaria anguillulae PL171]
MLCLASSSLKQGTNVPVDNYVAGDIQLHHPEMVITDLIRHHFVQVFFGAYVDPRSDDVFGLDHPYGKLGSAATIWTRITAILRFIAEPPVDVLGEMTPDEWKRAMFHQLVHWDHFRVTIATHHQDLVRVKDTHVAAGIAIPGRIVDLAAVAIAVAQYKRTQFAFTAEALAQAPPTIRTFASPDVNVPVNPFIAVVANRGPGLIAHRPAGAAGGSGTGSGKGRLRVQRASMARRNKRLPTQAHDEVEDQQDDDDETQS